MFKGREGRKGQAKAQVLKKKELMSVKGSVQEKPSAGEYEQNKNVVAPAKWKKKKKIVCAGSSRKLGKPKASVKQDCAQGGEKQAKTR